MFWIFKIFPDWIWGLLLLAGILAYLLSYLSLLKPYQLILKNCGLGIVAVSIFINGMLYCDNAWKQAASELQTKVDVAEAQSKITNEIIKEKVVYKTQIIKQRGTDITQFVEREVVKYDTTCVIPPEFITAHNRATEPTK